MRTGDISGLRFQGAWAQPPKSTSRDLHHLLALDSTLDGAGLCDLCLYFCCICRAGKSSPVAVSLWLCLKICAKEIWNWGRKGCSAKKPCGHDGNFKRRLEQEWNLEGNSRRIGHYVVNAFNCLGNFDGVVFAFKTFLEVNFRKEVGKKTIRKFRG